MSHHHPQKRAGHAQRASTKVWNPNDSRALKALEDRPYLAAQYLEGIEEEEEEVQVLEIADSYSSGATEDESSNVAPLLLSQTEDHPLYIPEGRRQVHNGCVYSPYPKVDVMFTTLNFVTAAIQGACVAEGKYFTVPLHNNRATNSFWFPLEGMKFGLWELYNGLEAWSRRIAQMESEKLRFDHQISTSTMQLTEQERLSMVYRALERVGDITDSYLHPYTGVPNQLEPVNVEIQKIMFLLTSIVEEGNTLAVDEVETDKDVMKNNIDVEDDSGEAKPNNDNSPTHPHDAADTNEPFVVLDDPLSRPPTPHDPNTPTWKQSLPLPATSLYVGPAELEIFHGVLALANEVQRALVSVVKLCEALHEKGRAMQKVWESWSGAVQAWNRRQRGEREEPRAIGYEMGG